MKENFDSALLEGINNEAIILSVETLIKKLETSEVDSKDFRTILEIITDMKHGMNSINDQEYLSSFMRERASRLLEALQKGISSEEISAYVQSASEKDSVNIYNVIGTLKDIEVRMEQAKAQKTNQQVFQKVLVNEAIN